LDLLIKDFSQVFFVLSQFLDCEQIHLDTVGVSNCPEPWNFVDSEESNELSVCHGHFIWGQVLEEQSHCSGFDLEIFLEDVRQGIHQNLAPEP